MSRGMKGAMERGWCDGRGNCRSTEPLWLLESVAAVIVSPSVLEAYSTTARYYSQYDLWKPATLPVLNLPFILVFGQQGSPKVVATRLKMTGCKGAIHSYTCYKWLHFLLVVVKKSTNNFATISIFFRIFLGFIYSQCLGHSDSCTDVRLPTRVIGS